MKKYSIAGLFLLILSGCAGQSTMQPLEYVDINRFMGDWFVVANIPTFLEKGAHNAVESYRLDDDGSVAATFSYNKDSFDGQQKIYNPRGFIKDDSNALWGMQFIWPFKADYRIVYLDDSYQNTVVAREARDYVWIMSRDPDLTDEKFDYFKAIVADLGYDVSKLERVPHQWSEDVQVSGNDS